MWALKTPQEQLIAAYIDQIIFTFQQILIRTQVCVIDVQMSN